MEIQQGSDGPVAGRYTGFAVRRVRCRPSALETAAGRVLAPAALCGDSKETPGALRAPRAAQPFDRAPRPPCDEVCRDEIRCLPSSFQPFPLTWDRALRFFRPVLRASRRFAFGRVQS